MHSQTFNQLDADRIAFTTMGGNTFLCYSELAAFRPFIILGSLSLRSTSLTRFGLVFVNAVAITLAAHHH